MKPEHRQHRKIGPLSDRAYRLWVAMVCEADDHGRLVADPEQLRVTVWGYHRKVTTAHVLEALGQLAEVGLVGLYDHDGVPYAHFPSWTDHQRVDHPGESRLPAPSREPSRILANDPGGSTRARGSDRIGRDQGSEVSLVGQAPDVASLNGHNWSDAREILLFLNQKTGRNFPEKLAGGKPSKSILLIEARLKSGATVQECRGVIARKVREWNHEPTKPDEKDMRPYLRPSTLFNATNFEQYLGLQEATS